MAAAEFDVCVFASSMLLTISIERAQATEQDELHFHPGGQGFWIARMLVRLGARPVLVAPLGGEAGAVLEALTRTWQVPLRPVVTADESPAYVHDRRTGARAQVAKSRVPELGRHERDDLYGSVLAAATAARACVVTGRFPGDSLPVDFYRRLGADLVSIGALTIGDLHGEELQAFLGSGALHTLKVSDDDLVADGRLAKGAAVDQRIAAMRSLIEQRVQRVVLSSADGPTLVATADGVWRASPPQLETVDHRGSGDSMTAALAWAALRGWDPVQTARIACAAGAANATRHGLGNADRDLVHSLLHRVQVEAEGTP